MSLLITTLIFGVGLLIASQFHVTHRAYVDSLRPRSAADSILSGRKEIEFVGRVTGMVDCRWADPHKDAILGAAVPLDRTYALAGGLMEITYDSGAKVILEGPCSYIVESPAGGFLALGKLTARVEERSEFRGLAASAASMQLQAAKPQAPRPKTQDLRPKTEISRSPNLQISKSTLHSPLFAVRTPTAVVTDLGTEFGVEVKSSRETQVHVFSGKVEAEWLGQAGSKAGKAILLEGEAARFDRLKSAVVTHSARPQEFIRAMPPRKGRPVDAAANKTIVKWSGVYLYGNPNKRASDWEMLDQFGVRHVNDGITDESEQGKSYWVGREQTEDEYFIIYLAGRYEVERIELVNTHNGPLNDRGTKDFEIWAADEVDGENELISPRLALKGTLPCRFGAGATIPSDIFSAENGDFERFQARYVKFVAKTYYSGEKEGGCGLNEIRVFAVPAAAKDTRPKTSPAKAKNKETY